MNIINLYLLSCICFKKITYTNIIDLIEQLNELLEEYNSDIIINFYKINNLNKELEKKNFFQIIFILKPTIFIEYKNDIFILKICL